VPARRINDVLDSLQTQAQKRMAEEGIAESRQRFEFSIDARHKGQINEVEILLPFERLPSNYESRLRALFVQRYEQLYGRGSAIVETADTTVVVHPGTTLRLDALGNFEITFK